MQQHAPRIEVLSSLITSENPAISEDTYDVWLIREERRKRIGALFEGEKNWRLSPDDHGNPQDMSPLAETRELTYLRQARKILQEKHADGTASFESPDDYERNLEKARNELKHYPVLFVSAPHIESNISGTFPGEPTPLLYATAVLDRHLRIDEFPSMKVPDIKAVMNPSVYNKNFEKSLEDYMRQYQPRVIGISNLSEGHHYALKIAEKIKALSPSTIVILGGAHEDDTNPESYKRVASVVRKKLNEVTNVNQLLTHFNLSEKQLSKMNKLRTLASEKEKRCVDFVVSGDAQYVLMELFTIISNHLEKSLDDLKRHVLTQRESISALEGNADLFFLNPDTHQIEDIRIHGQILDRSTLPFIYRGRLTQANRFSVFNGKMTAQVMKDFGCKYACEFCGESARQILRQVENVKRISSRTPKNVLQELDLLKEQKYEAIFFDDSTFTQNPKETTELLDMMIQRRKAGEYLEWGCQTTINDLGSTDTTGILEKMAEAGCTYIYFGFEQASSEHETINKVKTSQSSNINLPIYKRTWTEQYQLIAKKCHSLGIRVGTSLQFGLNECEEDRRRTIDVVAGLHEKGILAKNSVALNINTPIPGSIEWLKLMQKNAQLPDYRERLKRHPRFETAHQFTSLDWDIADDIYAYARQKLGTSLVGVQYSVDEAQKQLDVYENLYSKDFYFDDVVYQNYLAGKQEGIHFNSASIAAPCLSAKKNSSEVFSREDALSSKEKMKILCDARTKAAALVGLSEEKKAGVVFGRNTTEAASFTYWLAGLKAGDHVVLTDAENVSLKRMFEVHLDHGNPKREDGWSTWPTHYSERGPRYKDFIPDKTGVETSVIEVLHSSLADIESALQSQIHENTKAFVFSQVLRNSGKELPVNIICDMARKIKAQKNPAEPDLFILVDGAQALGNVPKVSFEDIGCDAYVATPHKTMKSEAIGLLYFNPSSPTMQQRLSGMNDLYYRDQQVILEGMFDESLGVQPNVKDSLSYADVVGFSSAVDALQQYGLENNDFTAISKKREKLKAYCEQQLVHLSDELKISITIPQIDTCTSFILSIQIPQKNGREIAVKLAQRGIFLSYIEGDTSKALSQILRISFQADNTREEVDSFIEAIKDVLRENV